MPYIVRERREDLAPFGYDTPENAGELNFVITLVIKQYWEEHGGYKSINDIIGALASASNEFYRRVAIPYENKKIADNGDVY